MSLKRKILLLILFFLVNLTNPWFLKVLNQEKIIGIILLLVTLSIIFYLINLSGKILFLSATCLFILTIFLIFTHFDKNLIHPSILDSYYSKQRANYYPRNLGKFIHNDYTLVLYKYQRNLFTNLDFNQFFFGGRPRLRPYAVDFEKFNVIFLPFFLIGIFYFGKNKFFKIKNFIILIIIMFLSTAFLNPNYLLGPYSLYPVIAGLITFGLYRVISFYD